MKAARRPSGEDGNDAQQGPLVPELEEIAPKAFADRIKRTGIVNAMASYT